MKICFISDTHEKHPPVLPSADLLVHCGDLTGIGTFKAFKKEVEWLSGLKHQYPAGIIFVPGNHDKGLDPDYIKLVIKGWDKDPYHNWPPLHFPSDVEDIKAMFSRAGIHLLINESVVIGGIHFYGSPLTSPFMNWAFMAKEVELAEQWQNIPAQTQVLITHGPPQNILDLIPSGLHVGSASLAQRAKDLPELKVHAFGHIHEGAGSLRIYGTSYS